MLARRSIQIGIDRSCLESGCAATTLVVGVGLGVTDGLDRCEVLADGLGVARGVSFAFGVLGFVDVVVREGLLDVVLIAAEFGETISDDSSTASNAPAGTVFS